MSVTTTTQPDFGDRVTFIDGDGEKQVGIVLEPIPDDEFVTLAVTTEDPREGYVGVEWTVETSVYPHADLGDEHTATTYAFKPGW